MNSVSTEMESSPIEVVYTLPSPVKATIERSIMYASITLLIPVKRSGTACSCRVVPSELPVIVDPQNHRLDAASMARLENLLS
ncbi:hypothetical protein D3C81_2050960 [compost metagenome]